MTCLEGLKETLGRMGPFAVPGPKKNDWKVGGRS